MIVWSPEALELLLRLLAEVAPIDEEKHPARPGVADEPVDGRNGEDRLAGPGRHLDQRARLVALERPVDVADCLDLDRIEKVLLQLRQRLDAAAERRRPRLVGRRMDASALQVQTFDPGVERLGLEPLRQRFRPVNVRQVRDAAALRIRVQTVDESRVDTGAHVQERERVDQWIQAGRQPGRILVRLQLDARQGVTDRLCFEDTGRLPVYEQHVIGEPVAGRHPELAHRHPEPGGEVHLVAVLDDPARLNQRSVDLLAGLLFRRQRHAHHAHLGIPVPLLVGSMRTFHTIRLTSSALPVVSPGTSTGVNRYTRSASRDARSTSPAHNTSRTSSSLYVSS